MASWEQTQESGNRAYCGGLFEAALTSYLEALELAKSQNNLSALGETWRGLAKTYLELGRIEEAFDAATAAEASDREFWGYENQQVSESMYWLAESLRRKENFIQARELFERVLQQRLATFGEMHDDTLDVFVHLIWLDLQEGRSESGIALTQRAATIFASLHPAGAFTRALNIKVLLRPYMDQNRPKDAEMITSRLHETLRTVLGATHPEIRQLLADCSQMMKDSNRQMAAWHLQTRADIIQKKESSNPWAERLNAPTNIVEGIPVLVDQSNVELAREKAQLMASGYAKGDATQGTQPLSAEQLFDKGHKSLMSGLYDSALGSYLAALEISRKLNDQPMMSEALRRITRIHLEIDMMEAAERSATEAADIDRAFYGKDSHYLGEDEFLLSDTLRRQGKFAQARQRLEAATLIRIKLYGEAHSETLSGMLRLIWIDLEEGNQQSLFEDVQYCNDIYSRIHIKQTFAQLLDLKALVHPYIGRGMSQQADSMLQALQAAACTIFGEDSEDYRNIESEIVEARGVLGIAPPDLKPKPKIQLSQSRGASPRQTGSSIPQVGAPQNTAAGADRMSALHDPGADRMSALHDPGADSELHVNEEDSEIIPALRINIIQKALYLSGIDADPNTLISFQIGIALVAAVWATVVYLFAGYSSVALECFLFTFICILAIGLGCLGTKVMFHQQRLETQLPNSLEIMVSLLQAGTPIAEAFEEISRSAPMPIRGEFQRVVTGLKSGKSFSQALEEMRWYVNLPQIAKLSDAINANRYGGGLAKQLEVLARELRDREKERLILRRSMAPIVLLPLLIALGCIKFLVDLSNPSVGAAFLDLPLTKVMLLLVYSCPLIVWVISKRSSRDQSTRAAAVAVGAAVNRFLKREKIRNELSSFLDLVVIHVKAGISLPQAVHKVINEGKGSCPTLAGELEIRLKGATSFSKSLPFAFKSLGEEYDLFELLTLAATIEATTRLRGSVSKQLHEQAESLRDHLAKARRARASSAYSTSVGVGILLFVIYLVISKLAHR